jgi:nitrite reductase/ring-hydroxylating ferredoxin subunit
MFQLVGKLSAFPEGRPVPVEVDGRSLVVVRWQEEVFAVRNICPHQSQALTLGQVHGEIRATGTVGEIELDTTEPVIVCPWHTWEFRLRDGRCVRDASQRVKSYATEVRGDSVFVEVQSDARAGREPAAASA